MTTPSGDPYQYGEDTVAARLDVDVSADAVQNLTDLTRLTADLRANMEATAKYSRDYNEYLRELPTALGEVDSAQSRFSQSRSSIFGGGDMSPQSDPFAGRDYSSRATDMSSQPGAGRPMRGIDQDTLIGLARDNPRQVANMAADRGLDEYFDDDQSHVLPRQAPGPRPSSGREMQFSGGARPPSTPRSPRSSTGPGDDDGRAAGTSVGRQVGPEGTESQAERAAKRLLAELEKGDDTRNLGQRARGLGDGIQNSSLLDFLNTEGRRGGRQDAIGFAGGLGRMAQSSGENFASRAAQQQEQMQDLLAQADEVADTNPELAAQLTERAQGMSGKVSMMGSLAPLARGAGIAGAGVAAVAGVNAAVQKSGETIQEYRGTGVQMGGGVAEGAAFEAQIRTMAMNPFISTEQSRKMMQSALQSGYTGKEFDTMTEFMADNLKSMNMEVAESTKLLQQNVLKGGQSVEGVQAQLAQNVAMAGTTNMSADQLNDFYAKMSGQLIDRGVSGQPSGEIAQIFSTLLEDNDVLKDSAPDTLAGIASNPTHQSYFATRSGAREAGISAVNSQVWAAENLSSEDYAQATVESIGDMLRPEMGAYTSGDENTRLSAIRRVASKLKVTENEAIAYMDEFASGDLLNRPAEAQKEWEEQGGGKVETNTSNVTGWGIAKSAGRGVMSTGNLIRQGWNWAQGDEEQLEEVKQTQADRRSRGNLDTQLRGVGSKGGTFTPEILKQFALEEYGGNIRDVVIVDEEGNEQKIGAEGLRDKEVAEKLTRGELSVKTQDGEVSTLRDWGNTVNTEEASGGGQQIGLTDEARRFFRLEGPNPVQSQANQGRTSHNSPEAEALGFGPQGGN